MNETPTQTERLKPEGLDMAIAIVTAIEAASYEKTVRERVVGIIKASLPPDEVAERAQELDNDPLVSSCLARAVAYGTALAMLRKTQSTVLVNLCGMTLARVQDEVLQVIGVMQHSDTHKEINTLVLDYVATHYAEVLDATRAQSVH